MTNDIKYLNISDIHLGNKRVTADFIIKNLDEYFDHYRDTSQFTDLDLIFISGDLFDKLLDFNAWEVHDIVLWIHRLMDFCGRYNIKLRILEGTPSHDWKQSKIVDTLHQITASNTALDFKYVETLHIELLKDLQLYILYVPDEHSPSTDETFRQVKLLMDDLNISHVDISIMHGSFNYQLKHVPGNIPKHNEADYLSITKHFINIGHIHHHNPYDRIIPPGSFDRIAFNEEHPKGGVVCTISPHGNYFNFIENTGAKIFKTIEIRHTDLDKAIARIDKVANSLPNDSFLRIKAKSTSVVYSAFDTIKLRHPMINFSKANLEDEILESNTQTQLSLDENYVAITISEDNVKELLMNEIKVKHSFSDTQLSLLTEILESTHV